MNTGPLTWLSEWYLSQCDDDWEHSYGVKIDTLDNPGWQVQIDLADTDLETRAFERMSHGEGASDLDEWFRTGSWWVAWVEDKQFCAVCGPLDLAAVIGVFRQWAELEAEPGSAP